MKKLLTYSIFKKAAAFMLSLCMLIYLIPDINFEVQTRPPPRGPSRSTPPLARSPTPPTAPARDAATTGPFTVTVTDGYGGTTPVTVSVPVAANIPGSTAKVTYVFNYTSNPQLYRTPEIRRRCRSRPTRLPPISLSPSRLR